MSKCASKVVKLIQSWVGKNEADGSHRDIIDIYNSYKPHPRGYAVTYTDQWCAATVSAVAIALGYTDVIPVECSCTKMIELLKKIDSWVENDAHIPHPGDLMFYDWEDSGSGDNKNGPDHVGIVEKVSGNTITVIEGNYKNAVTRRTIAVNGKYIRGYGVPKYDTEVAEVKPAEKQEPAEYKPTVREWQTAAIADGFRFPKYGADGKWGAECASVAKKAIVKRRLFYTNYALTRLVQRVVGVTVDGKCGKDTHNAIVAYQKKHGLTADGAVGINTWKKMLGV